MVSELAAVILGIFVQFFEIVSAVLIVFGGLRAALEILLVEAFRKPYSYEHIRKKFTNKIFFGLELLIVADVLETLRKPYLEELFLVGAIVVIRSYLGYFLSKEAEEYQFD
ncbi:MULTISPECIES: DUF1622 domain-containing protein [Methanosarcina]|uniref:DUF1622 domain-containing protein n=3 Tax=Methanosarcina mazei TaxID=2209 RepID=A0A0F8RIP6_METMZ|nr:MULTISPECIES: DUF1622 domain-containing protein [Methanosarcina]AGF95731.1 hypothetical protein MmTuc01_0282 [Methanosarcina mazei Tuc01]AKB60961.1 hypothetical protein MSMAP_0976 [Methanosarcina mazei SarPi]KKF97774.1 hypothetical protein DU40_01245 [Methanosarcina mazei]KKF98734.1 hypothetical protein DU47_07230 [Methanosarcina mazei]KKG73871.1 hypothetical protein DU63_19585 [Methanosarcina mazei]